MTDAARHQAEIKKDTDLAAWIGLFLGPLLLLACLLTDPPGTLSEAGWRTVGLTLLMATWWSTEAIPIPVTSLLPILMAPALGISTVDKASAPYANPAIFLFLGGFMLGLAMERWNLHKRIALMTLRAVGSQPAYQVAGFMLATAFLSMWVSNTATSIMMLPIGMSVITLLGDDNPHSERLSTGLLLGIAYAASIGGIATLIGTPPNALLIAFLKDNYDIHIGFGQWMLVGVPVSVVMLGVTWLWLTRGGLRKAAKLADSDALIHDELKAMGPLSRGEKGVAVVFVCAAFAWVFQPLIAKVVPGISDTSIAMAAAIALFLVPVSLKNREFLMSWGHAGKLPWGVLLLFGGGLSLAAQIRATGLADWIAQGMGALGFLPLILLIGMVVMVIIFLTEVTSNTATAAAFLPLLGALAVSQGMSPELLAIPAAIAASCAFMMPVATPPNAIVFGTGHLRIGDMIRAGFFLNLVGIVVVTLLSYVLVRTIW